MNEKEQITFDGIPIPLTVETILDAMEVTVYEMLPYLRRLRQYRAFRARILRLDAEKDRDIRLLKEGNMILAKLMVERVAAKDARIAELKTTLKWSIATAEKLTARIAEMESNRLDIARWRGDP
jgi:hypothetical protein